MKKFRVIPSPDNLHWSIVEEVQFDVDHPFDTIVCADTIKKNDIVDNTGTLISADPGKAPSANSQQLVHSFTTEVAFVQNYLTADTNHLSNLQSYRANTLIDISYWENPAAEKNKGIAKPETNPELEGLATDADKLKYFQDKLKMWDDAIAMQTLCIASDREELKTLQEKLTTWTAIYEHERALANT